MHFRKNYHMHKHGIHEGFTFIPHSKTYQKQVQDMVSILKEFSTELR